MPTISGRWFPTSHALAGLPGNCRGDPGPRGQGPGADPRPARRAGQLRKALASHGGDPADDAGSGPLLRVPDPGGAAGGWARGDQPVDWPTTASRTPSPAATATACTFVRFEELTRQPRADVSGRSMPSWARNGSSMTSRARRAGDLGNDRVHGFPGLHRIRSRWSRCRRSGPPSWAPRRSPTPTWTYPSGRQPAQATSSFPTLGGFGHAGGPISHTTAFTASAKPPSVVRRRIGLRYFHMIKSDPSRSEP